MISRWWGENPHPPHYFERGESLNDCAVCKLHEPHPIHIVSWNTDELMPSGRLDALVAKDVMGCNVITELGVLYKCGCEPAIHNPSLQDNMKGGRLTNRLKEYSSDMNAAWEVVEKLHDCKVYIARGNPLEGATAFYCSLDGSSSNAHGEAEKAPLAICRAALKTAALNRKNLL